MSDPSIPDVSYGKLFFGTPPPPPIDYDALMPPQHAWRHLVAQAYRQWSGCDQAAWLDFFDALPHDDSGTFTLDER